MTVCWFTKLNTIKLHPIQKFMMQSKRSNARDRYNKPDEHKQLEQKKCKKAFLIYFFYDTNGFPIVYDDYLITESRVYHVKSAERYDMLSIDNLSFYYKKDKCILKDVSVDIKPGINGFLGKNGVGKSTLIRILAKVQKSSSRISLNGLPISHSKHISIILRIFHSITFHFMKI